jgi:hypothetical protein
LEIGFSLAQWRKGSQLGGWGHYSLERAIFWREKKIAQGFAGGSLQRGQRRFFTDGLTSSEHFAEAIHFIFAKLSYSDTELTQASVQHRTGDAEAYAGAFQSCVWLLNFIEGRTIC